MANAAWQMARNATGLYPCSAWCYELLILNCLRVWLYWQRNASRKFIADNIRAISEFLRAPSSLLDLSNSSFYFQANPTSGMSVFFFAIRLRSRWEVHPTNQWSQIDECAESLRLDAWGVTWETFDFPRNLNAQLLRSLAKAEDGSQKHGIAHLLSGFCQIGPQVLRTLKVSKLRNGHDQLYQQQRHLSLRVNQKLTTLSQSSCTERWR